MNETYHIPVLLDESIDGLNINRNGIYVDVTYGGGGHSSKILEKLGAKGRLIAFDQDREAKANVIQDKRITFINHNFRYMRNFLRYLKVEKVHGLIADLGVSSHHFDAPHRGFSFRFDGELDMRMNTEAENSAVFVLNTYSQEKLSRMFWDFGDLKEGRKLATAIVQYRSTKKIETVSQFIESVNGLIPKHIENKFLAKVFQSIRMEVNSETDALKELLMQTPECIEKGGRLVVISYHSVEDKMVKDFIRSGNTEDKLEKDLYGNPLVPFKAIGKVLIPAGQEVDDNSRSRSAKLRIAERI